jgi:hypothetical protein
MTNYSEQLKTFFSISIRPSIHPKLSVLYAAAPKSHPQLTPPFYMHNGSMRNQKKKADGITEELPTTHFHSFKKKPK